MTAVDRPTRLPASWLVAFAALSAAPVFRLGDVQILEVAQALAACCAAAWYVFAGCRATLPGPWREYGGRYAIFLALCAAGSLAALRLDFYPPSESAALKQPLAISMARLLELSLALYSMLAAASAMRGNPKLLRLALDIYVAVAALTAFASILSWVLLVGGGISSPMVYGFDSRVRGLFNEGGPYGLYLVSAGIAAILRRDVTRDRIRGRAKPASDSELCPPRTQRAAGFVSGHGLSGADQAVGRRASAPEGRSTGAKAPRFSRALAARLKPCPDTNPTAIPPGGGAKERALLSQTSIKPVPHLVLFAIVLLLSGSKAGLLAAVLLSAMAGIASAGRRKKAALLLAGFMTLAVTVVVFESKFLAYWLLYQHVEEAAAYHPDDPNFVMGRVTGALIVPRMIAAHPVGGVGLGNYSLMRNNPDYLQGLPPVDEWDLPGMGLLGVAAELGTPLALFLFAVMLSPWRKALRRNNSPALAAAAAFQPVALLLGVNLNFFYPWLMAAFAIAAEGRS